MAVPGAEVTKGHLVRSARLRIHVMDLACEAIRRQPLCNRIGLKESAIDTLGRCAQDAVKIDGSGRHDGLTFSWMNYTHLDDASSKQKSTRPGIRENPRT